MKTGETTITTLYTDTINGLEVGIQTHTNTGSVVAHKFTAYVVRDPNQTLSKDFELDGTHRNFVDGYHAAKEWCRQTAETGLRGCSA